MPSAVTFIFLKFLQTRFRIPWNFKLKIHPSPCSSYNPNVSISFDLQLRQYMIQTICSREIKVCYVVKLFRIQKWVVFPYWHMFHFMLQSKFVLSVFLLLFLRVFETSLSYLRRLIQLKKKEKEKSCLSRIYK